MAGKNTTRKIYLFADFDSFPIENSGINRVSITTDLLLPKSCGNFFEKFNNGNKRRNSSFRDGCKS
jgi:hypothetical protein